MFHKKMLYLLNTEIIKHFATEKYKKHQSFVKSIAEAIKLTNEKQ